MSKGERKFAPLFRVVLVDAWAEGEDSWSWNDTMTLFEFRTEALNVKRTFLSRLRHFLKYRVYTATGLHEKHDLGRGWYYCTDDWDIMEVCSRSDHRPWYACIRITPSH